MSNAPGQIWIWVDYDGTWDGTWLADSVSLKAHRLPDAKYVRADRIEALEAERDALAEKMERAVEAMKRLQDDMLERARFGMDVIHGEQYCVVNAGDGAWSHFCATIAAIQEDGKDG